MFIDYLFIYLFIYLFNCFSPHFLPADVLGFRCDDHQRLSALALDLQKMQNLCFARPIYGVEYSVTTVDNNNINSDGSFGSGANNARISLRPEDEYVMEQEERLIFFILFYFFFFFSLSFFY